MADLPGGTVTFLLTDVEGSTALWERAPAAMRAALARHDELVSEAAGRHGGTVVKSRGEGDSAFAVFARAGDAVAAAADLQRALHAEPWPTSAQIRVRIALHTGETDLRDGDYYGTVVNRCARLRAAAHGGQILVSQAVHDIVREACLAGVGFIDLGEHRLKDLTLPERVFQVVVPDLPSEFPPLVSLAARPNNLPVRPTPLVGRERDVVVARERLLREDVRLLTLTGPGGIGKTLLSLHVAADVSDHFVDGVFFVALAPISDPELVPSMIARTLGVRDAGGRPVLETLQEYLREKQLLLLLDNFEQILAAAPVVSALLRTVLGLKILVTSRAALQVRGEHELVVSPLAVPDPEHSLTVDALSRYGAVALFVERAAAIKDDFTVTNENAPAVAEICRRLDGLPLAIELAAMRIRLLGPQAMLTRLEHRLPLLTGGARDLPARQRTLRGAIEWSYDLLDEREQRLFRWLAVFAGGCGLEAAEAICESDAALGVDVLDGLGSLVAKSLLRQEEDAGEPRFGMLETIREYGLDQLEASGEATAVRRRHRDWFLGFAERAAAALRGPRQAEWFERLEAEHDNLRAALEWSTAQADGLEAGARMAEALAWYWVLRGHVREGRARLERLVARAPGHGPVRARILSVAGFLAERQGDYAAAIAMLREALRLWRASGDERGIATVLWSLRVIAQARGDVEQATTLLEECVALFRRGGAEVPREAVIAGYAESPIVALAYLAQQRGEHERAGALYKEDLALSRARGDLHGVANTLRGLASLAYSQGDLERATDLFKESLVMFYGLRDLPCAAHNVTSLAAVASAQGRPERGARLLAAGEILQEVSGVVLPPGMRADHDRCMAEVHTTLGEAAFTAARAEGRAMTMEQAVAYALAGEPAPSDPLRKSG